MQIVPNDVSSLFSNGGILKLHVKLEILGSDYQPVAVVREEDIIDGQVSVSKDRKSVRDFSMTLSNASGAYTPTVSGLIWLDKKFKPYIGVETAAGITWFPQGVFPCSRPNAADDKSQPIVRLQSSDKMSFLGTTKDTVQIKANVMIDTAITEVLRGRETMFLFDPLPNTADYKLPYDMSFEPGTEYQEIITKLAGIITWDLFYDVDGYLRLRQPIDPATTAPCLALDSTRRDWNLYISGEQEIDDSKLTNHILVRGGSSQTAFVSWEWEDNDPNSPTFVQSIGRRTYLHNSGNPDPVITTAALAEARGKYERRNRQAVTYKKQFKSVLLPFLEHEDVVHFNNPRIGAAGLYQIINLTIPFKQVEMSGECWQVKSFG